MPTQPYFDDDGTAITAEVVTQPNYIAEPDQIKVVSRLFVFATPRSTLKVHISYGGGDWSELGQVKSSPQRFDLGMKKCYYLQLKITESSSNEPFDFSGYTIEYELSKEVR